MNKRKQLVKDGEKRNKINKNHILINEKRSKKKNKGK